MTAFLFDLDGTLNDSVPLILRVAQLTYEDLGISRTREQIMQTIGEPLVTTGEALFGPGNGDIYRLAYHSRYVQEAEKMPILPFPGILDMLDRLREKGAKLAVVTSKRRRLTRENLTTAELLPRLDAVVDAESTEEHKPHPAPALLALAELGAQPSEGVFVGDSRFDLACGRNAGLVTVGVSWGAGSLAELEEQAPDHLCHSVEELTALLLSLC